jgi:hypothetical protein
MQHLLTPEIHRILELIHGSAVPRTGDCARIAEHGLISLAKSLCPEEYYRHLGGIEIIREEFMRLCDLLNRERLPFLVLKGLALSEWLYGHYYVRGSSDIDLSLRAADCDRARDCLIKAGYHQATKERHLGYVESFLTPRRLATIEVHFALSPEERFTALLDQLWSNPTTVPFQSIEVLVPDKEAYLAYLLMHLARHYPHLRALWIEDVRKYFERFGPSLERDRFVEIATRGKIVNAVLVGLQLCEEALDMHGTDVAGLLRRLKALLQQRQSFLAGRLTPYLLRQHGKTKTRHIFHQLYAMLLAGEWSDRIVIIRSIVRKRLPKRSGGG